MSKKATPTSYRNEKILLVGIYAPYNRKISKEHYFEEFKNLANTLEINYTDEYFMKLRSVDKNNFLSKGKLEDLATYCKTHDIDEVVISEILSPLQERNLEDKLDCKVFDREKLILEIFKCAAHSSEGKIQVEMAEIGYLKTRIIGKGKEYAQQAGFIGERGPGETIKEEIRRHFEDRIRQARKRLTTLQKSREVQRKRRLSSNLPLICIIGYTNAGKSSLLNTITKTGVLAEDKLFATLDTTTREWYLDDKCKVLISDTVGFINQLPHSLIEAFKSTLDELRYATQLVQVIDLSNPMWQSHIEVVHQTLQELEVDKPMLYVFNKIDTLTEEEVAELEETLKQYQPHVLIHTLSKDGVSEFIDFVRREYGPKSSN